MLTSTSQPPSFRPTFPRNPFVPPVRGQGRKDATARERGLIEAGGLPGHSTSVENFSSRLYLDIVTLERLFDLAPLTVLFRADGMRFSYLQRGFRG